MEWNLDMLAEAVIPAWKNSSTCNQSGSELQRAIIKGFGSTGDPKHDPHSEFTFIKIFTFKEHGEFFRGALTMAGIRYTGDFYELLKRYETIKVTITKSKKEEKT